MSMGPEGKFMRFDKVVKYHFLTTSGSFQMTHQIGNRTPFPEFLTEKRMSCNFQASTSISKNKP